MTMDRLQGLLDHLKTNYIDKDITVTKSELNEKFGANIVNDASNQGLIQELGRSNNDDTRNPVIITIKGYELLNQIKFNQNISEFKTASDKSSSIIVFLTIFLVVISVLQGVLVILTMTPQAYALHRQSILETLAVFLVIMAVLVLIEIKIFNIVDLLKSVVNKTLHVEANSNAYKYIILILAIIGIVIMTVIIAYNLGYMSGISSNQIGYTTIKINTSTIQTSIPTTINFSNTSTTNPTKSLYCNTQPTFVPIGNSLVCGSFSATILNATTTSVSLRATYNGISINKTVTNPKGYIGDTFALNFSGTVVFARVWGYLPSNQTVYFQMSTAPVVLTTTITLPSTSSTTAPPITTTI